MFAHHQHTSLVRPLESSSLAGMTLGSMVETSIFSLSFERHLHVRCGLRWRASAGRPDGGSSPRRTSIIFCLPFEYLIWSSSKNFIFAWYLQLLLQRWPGPLVLHIPELDQEPIHSLFKMFCYKRCTFFRIGFTLAHSHITILKKNNYAPTLLAVILKPFGTC